MLIDIYCMWLAQERCIVCVFATVEIVVNSSNPPMHNRMVNFEVAAADKQGIEVV